MSETGDTGQGLPVKLPEKATDADVEDKSTTDAEQKPGKEAGEMTELATANTTDKHSAISDADQKEDLREDEKDSLTSTTATAENQETTSHAEKIEETASDDEKGATAFAHLKKASVAVADEKKAPTAFAEKKETSAVVEEKKELAAVADEKRAAKAFADEKQKLAAFADEKQKLVAVADEKQKLAAFADEKQKLAAVADEKKAPTAVSDVKNGPTAVEEEKKATAAVAYVNKASTTFADEKSAPTAVAEAKKESAAGAYEMKAPTTFANEKKQTAAAVVDKMKESTAVEDKKQEKEDEFLDILGNGTLLKKVLEAGSGSRPSMGDEVIVQVTQEIPEIGKTFPEEQLQYVLGDGDVVNALDLVVALMNIGEKARIITGYKYMYGDLGLEPDIPPRSNFMLTVKLIANNGPLDYETMDFGRRFAEGFKKKERGNFLFKRKEFSLALNSYTKAGRIVDPSIGTVFNDESAESLQKLLEFRAIVLCNTSAAQLKMEAYDAAARSASEAVQLLPSHHKAYIRLGQAQEKLGKTDQTIRNYKLALKYDPDNSKWLHGELERLTKKDKKSKMNQQEMYSKMFWGSSPPPVDRTEDTPPGASMFRQFEDQFPVNNLPLPDPDRVWMHIKNYILWHLGIVIGEKVRLGEMSREEIERMAEMYIDRFENNGVELTAEQLMDLSRELSTWLPEDVCKLLEARSMFMSAADLVNMTEEEDLTGMNLLDPAPLEDKPVSSIFNLLQPFQFPKRSTNMLYDEGTDVDTGMKSMTDIPPNYVIELKKLEDMDKPKKKSSWLWNTGAAVIGAGLVGLAGIGIYKYLNH